VQALMDARGVHFAVELDESPLRVEGDPARLQQIQVNLLSNAAKYTERGGHVVLALARERDEAVIRVHDDGAGLPAEMLESIFDLFVQASRTLDRAAGGLGVGLTLVRSLVVMHGGTVTAASAGVGRGSEFTVRLPLTSRLPQREAPPSTVSLRGPAPAARIVIVEDNSDSLEILYELLAEAGYECHTASTGPAALKVIADVRPDIAILDVGLPEMDGFEVARRLRRDAQNDDVCLIAMTGYGRASDREMAKSVGFDQHLVKPVEAAVLLELVGKMRAMQARPWAASAPPGPRGE
jgi:CheY-like chemotaxis protein/anti-sigma regulatory factor (Ser/Thr protein kinase)